MGDDLRSRIANTIGAIGQHLSVDGQGHVVIDARSVADVVIERCGPLFRGAAVSDFWAAGYDTGASDAAEVVRNLIKELGERHPGDACSCGWCDRDNEAADRAAARLREVGNE